MTALDQAFIKAFARQDTVPLAAAPPAATPKKAKREAQGKREAVELDAANVGVAVALPSRVHGCGSATAAPTALRREAKSKELKPAVASPQPPIANSQPSIASVAFSQDVWSALEQRPKAMLAPAKTAISEPEITCRAEQMDRSPADSQSAVAIGLWTPAAKSPTTVEDSKPDLPDPKALIADSFFLPKTQSAIPSARTPQSSPAATPPVHREFKPAWQVEQFTWPRLCRKLVSRAAEELDRLADALLTATVRGQKVLAMAGCHRGEGTTTLLLCAARRLAERGIKPVLVDADLGRPRLAKRLGVQPQFGWDETTEQEGRRLDQAIVEATGNNLALLPLREPDDGCGRATGDASRLTPCLQTLREHYDAVLVDLGPLPEAGLSDGAWSQAAGAVDAVVLVHNRRVTSERQQQALQEQLKTAGITVAGIVENFVSEQ
jgi:Mrp family chromosome partitioning ATPase